MVSPVFLSRKLKGNKKCFFIFFPPHWIPPVVLLKVWLRNTAALLNLFILGLKADKKHGAQITSMTLV